MDFNKRLFSERLRNTRVLYGYTQKDLAEKIGIDQTRLSKYESMRNSRNPSITMLLKLAQALHVSTDYLLGNDAIKN